jgi:spore maturation protein CgeB
LKILLLGSHLGYNLEHYVKMALEKLGSQVEFVGYRDSLGPLETPVRVAISRSRMAREFLEPFVLRTFNERAKRVGGEFSPELVLAIKGEALLPKTLKWFSHCLGVITALWCPDDPRYFHSLSKLIAPAYDFVFTSSERFVSVYRGIGAGHVEHLPFACEPSVHRPVALSNREKEALACDVCFVGAYSRKRAVLIRALERGGFRVNVWGPYWRYFMPGRNVRGPLFGHKMVRVFNAAKLVLNVHTDTDTDFKPNMRIFEAAGCRSLVLTDDALGLRNLFKPNEEIVCYSNKDDLLREVTHYTQSGNESATIATKGQERAYRDHTYERRMGELLTFVRPRG